MERRKKPTCVRCIKPRPAEVTEKFTYDGRTYELDLCTEHLDAFARDMRGWVRLASEVEERPDYLTSTEWALPLRSTPIPPASTPAAPIRTARRSVERRARPRELSPTTLDWTLSDHAEQRLAERGTGRFTRREVFEALENGVAYPVHDGKERRVYGRVSLVVDPVQRAVVTVEPNEPGQWEARVKEVVHARS